MPARQQKITFAMHEADEPNAFAGFSARFAVAVLPRLRLDTAGGHRGEREGVNLRGEIPMRIPTLAVLTIAAVLAAPPARAQTYDPAYPVCLQVYQGIADYYFECGYTSLAQCNMSASGRAAQCIVNPYYAGRKTAPPARRDRRHRGVN
jgi:hypothetical protein